jgi:uncharacterized protein YkwD
MNNSQLNPRTIKGIVFFVIVFAVVTLRGGVLLAMDSKYIVDLTNAAREASGAGPLVVSPELSKAAYDKSRDMCVRSYWSHTAPDGTTGWAFIEQYGYVYEKAGENLARGYETEWGVFQGWVESYAHHQNMLNPIFTEIGVESYTCLEDGDNATRIYTTALYAKPIEVSDQKAEVLSAASNNQENAVHKALQYIVAASRQFAHWIHTVSDESYRKNLVVFNSR